MMGRADRSLEARRILVVEDEYLIAMEVEDVLRDLGAEVIGPFARLEPALELPITRSFMVPCLMFGSTEKLSRRSPRLLFHAEFQFC